ncbi:MAG: IscA/HesB family protein [Proteobacteria bacterium]|nr:IscA/HesB family protein [Pseudomonadota bacterium]MBU1451505.1 IscA/HesB family protein [Pseudomonadota bacterium]MBU2470460.1 IscA/HesB family protein [Pseudomonadota bacterium]MBU2519021.1 IscA/HesB family protein [Pseudomonadota bacterium]
MMEVTPAASEALKAVMAEKNLEPPIRIFLQSGCSGSQLALGVDEARDGDDQFDVDGVSYVVDKNLSDLVGDMKLDYLTDEQQQGFLLSSSKPLPQPEGGGCSSGCCGC